MQGTQVHALAQEDAMLSPRGQLQPLRPHGATAAARSEPALRDQRSAALRSPARKPGAAPARGNKDPAQPKRNKNKPFLGFYTRIDLLLDLVHAISLLIHFTHLLTHPSHYNFLSCSLYFCRFMLFKLLFYHLK